MNKFWRFIKNCAFLLMLVSLPASIANSADEYNCFNDRSIPPFISTGAKPNILIILDNSNSMDEDFHGEAVGSYSPVSKSAVARQAVLDIVENLKDKVRIGLLTYKLDGSVKASNLHNSTYFSSYELKSYCPTPSDACDNYCLTGDPTAKSNCTSSCQAGNKDFDPDYIDEILTTYSGDAATKGKYCSLIYPKTEKIDTTISSVPVYYKNPRPYYSSENRGISYCYSPYPAEKNYNPSEGSNGAWDWYGCSKVKNGSSDAFDDYGNIFLNEQFIPTDSDKALGYLDFGRRLALLYVGPTYFSNISPGKEGQIHVPVGELTQVVNEVVVPSPTLTSLEAKLAPKIDTAIPPAGADYMACASIDDKNLCPYIVNAGLTPTEGSLQTAIEYFKGLNKTYPSPIESNAPCRKNFIIYVTDGLPSVDAAGAPGTAASLVEGGVKTKLQELRSITKLLPDPANPKKTKSYTFDVKTYVLGVGLSAESKKYLDRMAYYGGTASKTGHAYYADSKDELEIGLTRVFGDILGRTASGSSISILSEKAQMGANIVQAVFYPSKQFESTDISWIGYIYNYWFYVSRSKSNIREDSKDVMGEHDYALKLKEDKAITFNFDEASGLYITLQKDTDGDGEPETSDPGKITLDELSPIWEAGNLLFKTMPANRKIYTAGPSDTLIDFNDTNMAASPLLGSSFTECLSGSDNNAKRTKLIDYVRGTDILNADPVEDCRNRTVTVGAETKTWKLSDIVYSTPKIQGDYKNCFTYTKVDDVVTGNFHDDRSCSTDAQCSDLSVDPLYPAKCKERESLVFVGANDGMLHAFHNGALSKENENLNEGIIGELTGIPTENMGKELWAFIPKNALPYLRCLADPDYCHLSYIDLTPYLTTMKSYEGGIEKIKKVLIGGMRLGGGSCTTNDGINFSCGAPSDTCDATITCPNNNTCFSPANCTGLSSYFALDVTIPTEPKLLWEFTHPRLGYSYSGPAVIRRTETVAGVTKTRHFVMFLSGPTTRDGRSNQDLHVFVLSLNDELKLDSTGVFATSNVDQLKNLNNAFGGRLFTDGIDVNKDGNTDYVLFGYSQENGGVWQGNIAKVYINGLIPASWKYQSNAFNLSSGPITTKVEFSTCFDRPFIYATSGKFFYPQDTYRSNLTDRIMGFEFPCKEDGTCGTGTWNSAHRTDDACNNLGDARSEAAWYQELESVPTDAGFLKERSITDPTVTPYDMVFFTTTEPTANICGYGGRSRVWGLNCATGQPLADTSCTGYTVKARGTVYIQTSTGAINKIDPTSSFAKDSPTSDWFAGIPPESAPPFVPPSGMKNGKIVHWNEK